MLFNSLTFVVFFVLVLALHNAPLAWKTKKTNLLIASYLFYAAWNPPFVILLWISTVIDWHVAKKIFVEQAQNRRRMLLTISIIVNLGLLGYFKYGGFLLENFVSLVAMAGIDYQPPDWHIVLPVGISFYTFQTMAYSFDVYLRRASHRSPSSISPCSSRSSRNSLPDRSCAQLTCCRNSRRRALQPPNSFTGVWA